MSKNSQKPEGELPPQKISTEFEKEIYEFPKEVNLLLKAISQVPTDEPFKAHVLEDVTVDSLEQEMLARMQERIQKSIDSILKQELVSEQIVLNSPNADYINNGVDPAGASSHTSLDADYPTQ